MATSAADMRTCEACGTVNTAQARFCANCGHALPGGDQPRVGPTPPPPPPLERFGRFAFGGAAAMVSPAHARSLAPLPPEAAYAHVADAVAASGGEVLGGIPGQYLDVLVPYKDMWTTLGISVRYRGQVSFAPQDRGTTLVEARFSVDWGSTVSLFATLFGLGVLWILSSAATPVMRHLGGLMLLFTLAMCIVTAATLVTKIPGKVGARFLTALSSGGAGRSANGPDAIRHPISDAEPPPAAGATARGNGASIFEQVEQLARLRDVGAVTPEEFEAKKAELLARL